MQGTQIRADGKRWPMGQGPDSWPDDDITISDDGDGVMRDGTVVNDPSLGRLRQFDTRSRKFPIRKLLTSTQIRQPRSYTWEPGIVMDQSPDRPGQHAGSCVGHAFAADLAAKPGVIGADEAFAYFIYCEAQRIDPWAGDCSQKRYEGTSVLAGGQVCHRYGFFKEYRWVFGGAPELASGVGFGGPAIIGINWYDGMFQTSPDGEVTVSGSIAGGHALLVYAVNVKEETFTIRNSWGTDWGDNGDCWMSWATMDRLLKEDGEAMIPMGRVRMES